jgi:hypothetical protein
VDFPQNNAAGTNGGQVCSFICTTQCQPILHIAYTSTPVNARFNFMISSYWKGLTSGDKRTSELIVSPGKYSVVLSGVSVNGIANVFISY